MQAFDQRYLLNRIEWDNLIVLDACRYDIFRRVWSREEKVIGVISPASWTLEWLDRVFGNVFIEAEVFSATPYINSLTEINMYGVRWNAREHFRKIIDLWLTAWDPRLGIVPPQKVYLAVIVRNIGAKYTKKSTIRKRFIFKNICASIFDFVQGFFNRIGIERVLDIYRRMSYPKWVVAVGRCVLSENLFSSNSKLLEEFKKKVDIDVYVPGCPPRPEAFLYSVLKLRDKI